MKAKKFATMPFYIPTELVCVFILLIKIAPNFDLSEGTSTVIDTCGKKIYGNSFHSRKKTERGNKKKKGKAKLLLQENPEQINKRFEYKRK